MNDGPISAYPLQWPAGWKRSAFQETARFRKQGSKSYAQRLTVADSVERVFEQLERMGIDEQDVVLNSNIPARLNGLPKSGLSEPEDRGAVVYWQTRDGERLCMAIDRYDKVADNFAAIAATLDAMRAIERHGGGEILERAFTGFTALPAPAADVWYSILGYGTEDEALNASPSFEYRARRLLSLYHPDNGKKPDRWQFDQVIKARKAGRDARA